jgi:hypothetical protein
MLKLYVHTLIHLHGVMFLYFTFTSLSEEGKKQSPEHCTFFSFQYLTERMNKSVRSQRYKTFKLHFLSSVQYSCIVIGKGLLKHSELD